MKLRYCAIGGFAGPAVPQIRELDLATLSDDAADQIRQDVAALDFFGLPASQLKSAPKSWDFLHEVRITHSVEEGGVVQERHHQVQFHSEMVSAALNDLVAKILTLTESTQ